MINVHSSPFLIGPSLRIEVKDDGGVWDPVRSAPELTLSGGRLTVTLTGAGGNDYLAIGSGVKPSGKWHAELAVTEATPGWAGFGIGQAATEDASGPTFPGYTAHSLGVFGNDIYKGNALIGSAPGSLSGGASNRYTIEADLDARTVKFALNGGSFSSALALPSGDLLLLCSLHWEGDIASLLLRESEFTHAVTTGFAPWNPSAA